MTRGGRSDLDLIEAAREHLDMIDKHLRRGDLDDVLVRDAVSHRLEVAIDVLAKVSPELLQQEAPEDWPKIVGMRNLLAHQYTDLDQEILQNTVDHRLDGLKRLACRLRQAAELQAHE